MNERLTYALLELWEAQESNDRWTELEYVLREGLSEVAHIHPDEIDPEEDILERRERSLLRHLGKKPVLYPPLLPRYAASDLCRRGGHDKSDEADG